MLGRNMLRTLILTAAIANVRVWAADVQPAASQPANANLPVVSVTLFSSGVGYFEHAGQVTGDGSAVLNFKTAQINDILKSLVVQDEGGGHVSAVQYPSQDPVEKTLKSFGVDITNNPPLADLLNQLRGAEVSIDSAGQTFEGVVLGVEKHSAPIKADSDATADAWLLNLIDGATIRQIDLSKVSDIKLDNPALKDELAEALKTLAQARDQDKKTVTIQFTGKGDHAIRVGYVVEAPVWKASYRLLLPDANAQDKSQKPMLHGWAIVENQTDSDWKDVKLSLVSGRPISFVMDLYQPLYNPRPTMQLNLLQNLQAQVYAPGINAAAPMAAAAMDEQQMASQSMAARSIRSFNLRGTTSKDYIDALSDSSATTNSAMQSLSTTQQVGDLFQYTVENVSLPRQKSAMIPIVSDPIDAEKLSIFNESVLPRNPLKGALLTNTTGKHLLQGPITVYDGGYAGDAQIDNLPPGQKRLISFGVDQGTLVDVNRGSVSTLVGGKIIKGVLQLDRKLQQTCTYTAQNKADADKTLIIEHPFIQNWTLIDTPAPMETTDKLDRFKLDLPKASTKTFKVTEQSVQSETIAILDGASDQLIALSKEGGLTDKVRDALTQAIAKRQAYDDLSQQVSAKDDAIKAIADEQTRLREDLKAVDKTTPYANRLLSKLNDQETQIEKLQGERDDLDKKATQAKQAWMDYVQTLDVG